jgi:hypothetical protein
LGASGSSSSGSGGGSSSGGSTGGASTAKIGVPASDGKFTFTVNSVQCGIPSVGDSSIGLEATAQGQFCKVNVKVANTGSESQSLFASNQYAYDTAGKKLSVSTDAELYSQQTDVMFVDINPGNSVTGDLYFDIPAGDSITKFEFHDSAFSGGVSVSNAQ